MYVVVVAEKQTEVRGVETKLERTDGGLREAEKRGGERCPSYVCREEKEKRSGPLTFSSSLNLRLWGGWEKCSRQSAERG